MGRLIDEDILIDSIPDLSVFEQEDFGTPDMIRLIEDAPTVEAIPKDQYEKRLKADMVAILEDLQLELEELPKAQFYKQNENGDVIGCIEYPAISKGALLLIQEKINALKAESEWKK